MRWLCQDSDLSVHDSIAVCRKAYAAKSPKKESIISGNIFKFYVPTGVAMHATSQVPPSLALKRATLPTPKSAPAGAPPRLTPKKHIHKEYRALGAGDALFKALGASEKHLITQLNLIGAALECGYGRRKNWTAPLILNAAEGASLAVHVLLRVKLVLNCLELNGNNSQAIKEFYEHVESTEKGDISFVLGGLCTFLAARLWLRATMDPLQAFLHVGLCANALSTPLPFLKIAKSGTKSLPDYVAVSASTKLHLYESKGGELEAKWGRLMEGLDQLYATPSIGWGAPLPNAVESMNCVHVTVDAGRALEVTVVDPPPERLGQTDDAPQEPVVFFLPGVARLLQVLEAVDYYRALTDELVPEEELGSPTEYQIRPTAEFGGLLVGIPKAFIRAEQHVRLCLAVFMSIREVLDDTQFFIQTWPQHAFRLRDEVIKRLQRPGAEGLTYAASLSSNLQDSLNGDTVLPDGDSEEPPQDGDSEEPHPLLAQAIQAASGANRHEDMLVMVANQLELDRLATDLFKDVPLSHDQEPLQSDEFFTTGGLMLKLAGGPESNTD